MTASADLTRPLWTIEDLATYLAVPVNTIYDWRKRGGGPTARRIGRHLRFHPDDVSAWLEDRAERTRGKPRPIGESRLDEQVSDDEFWAA